MRRLMEYKIISGRVVEIRRSWIPTDNSYSKPRGTRRAGASSEKKIKANEKSCIRNLARVLNCNYEAGDIFSSQKYDAQHQPKTYEEAEKNLSRFLDKLRKAYRKQTGKALRAVWVTANWSPHHQCSAKPHHHLVLPADALELSRSIWEQFGGKGTYKMESLNGYGDYSRLAAYLVENTKDLPASKKRWSCSRGMDRPIYTEPVEVSDVEAVQPEYGSTVMDCEQIQDEDGRTVSAYLRCRLDARPRVRGGQIILPRKPRRKKTE